MDVDAKGMFDSLSDAILFVTEAGELRFSNRVARETWGLVDGTRIVNAGLENLVGWGLRGFVQLPMSAGFDIDETNGVSRLIAHIHRSSVAGEYAVVVRPEVANDRWQSLGGLLLDAVQREIVAPATACSLSLSLAAQYLAGQPERGAAASRLQQRCADHAERLAESVRGLRTKVDTVRLAELGAVETFPFAALIDTTVNDAREILAARRQRVLSDTSSVEFALVSGSPWWYGWVLADLVRSISERAPSGCNLTLHADILYQEVVLRIGHDQPPAGWRKRLPQMLDKIRGIPEKGLDRNDLAAGADHHGWPMRLGSRFAGQLLAHYGGALLASPADAAEHCYLVRLPMRSPSSGETWEALQQRTRVASDLAELFIGRIRKGARLASVPWQQSRPGPADGLDPKS